MIEAGLLLGLSREISTQLVVQTMLGTAKQLRDGGMHPVELREMVTSPGGTTIAAIRELESAGVRAAFLNAIQAAMTRARELAAGRLSSASRCAPARSRPAAVPCDARCGRPTSPPLLRPALAMLDAGALAIDCGANVGDVTALLAAAGAGCIAIEPNPVAFARARRRASRRRRASTAFRPAVSTQDGFGSALPPRACRRGPARSIDRLVAPAGEAERRPSASSRWRRSTSTRSSRARAPVAS